MKQFYTYWLKIFTLLQRFGIFYLFLDGEGGQNILAGHFLCHHNLLTILFLDKAATGIQRLFVLFTLGIIFPAKGHLSPVGKCFG